MRITITLDPEASAIFEAVHSQPLLALVDRAVIARHMLLAGLKSMETDADKAEALARSQRELTEFKPRKAKARKGRKK